VTDRRPGSGDEGLAEDLLPLAEVDIWPAVDWGVLADTLNLLEGDLSADERAEVIRRARAIAGENPSAIWLVEDAIAETA
jgi:hypothetical protein